MGVTADDARQLIERNLQLARRMGDLAIDAANAATALASRGAPAAAAFVESLTDAGRAFESLRTEAFAAAASLDLPLPAVETVDCTSKLESMLGALLATVEAAERQAASAADRTAATKVLERVARLTHRETRDFEPLLACQAAADKLRNAIAGTSEIDAAAIEPFTALLQFIDSHDKLDDDHWGALQEMVSAAFGVPLATAAGRGRLVSTG